MDSIDFLAQYKGWIAVKKLEISEDTKPEEVAFHLASIRESIDRKAFEILGIDTSIIDNYVSNIIKGKRKDFKTLGELISEMSKKEAKDIILSACKGKEELLPIANAYFLRSLVIGLGFDFDVSRELLSRIFPYLKVPRLRGRKKKGS